MAKTYLAKQSELDSTKNDLSNLIDVVENPGTGIEPRVTGVESEIENINSTIGADDTSGIRKRIADNESAIGDETGGLVKGQNDLFDVVGADNTQGLQKRVVDLEESVGTDDTSGLRKDSVDLKAKTSGFTYDDTTKRITQVAEPTETASDDKDILTKKDGDELYGGESVATSSAGGYNSDTESATWNELCSVGNIKIDGRFQSGDSVARIVNSTGSTVVAIYDENDEGTLANGTSNISNGGSLELNASSTANSGIKTFRAGIYTSPGVNTEAYTVEVYLRNTSVGIRIACSIVGKF